MPYTQYYVYPSLECPLRRKSGLHSFATSAIRHHSSSHIHTQGWVLTQTWPGRVFGVVKDKHISRGSLGGNDEGALGHVASPGEGGGRGLVWGRELKEKSEELTDLLTSPSWLILMSTSIFPLTEPNPPYSTDINSPILNIPITLIHIMMADLPGHCRSEWHRPEHRHWASSHWLSPDGSAHLSSCRETTVASTSHPLQCE